MTTILALDSSSENCSAALLDGQKMTVCSEHAPRKHTQLILPLSQTVLVKAEKTLADVQAIAFGAGPGSFTGIRIAAGVAQGLAYGLDVPIYAISNLKALALQSYLEHGTADVLSCIDARMGEVYWAVFKVKAEEFELAGIKTKRYFVDILGHEQVTAPEQVMLPGLDARERPRALEDSDKPGAYAGIGSGIKLLSEDIASQLCIKDISAQPCAETVAYLADTAIQAGESGHLNDALPSYVRDTVTWNKLPGRE